MAVASKGHLGGGLLRSGGLALGSEGPIVVRLTALHSLGALLLLQLLLLHLVQLCGGVPRAVDLRDGKVPGALYCKTSTATVGPWGNVGTNSQMHHAALCKSLAPRS